MLWGDEGPEVKAGAKDKERFETAEYDELWAAESAAFKAERVRLAYVAMTRARDRLVLSLFRPAPSNDTLAREIAPRCPPVPKLEAAALPAEATRVAIERAEIDAAWLDERAAWVEGREAALARLGRSPAVAATRIQHLAKAAVGADVEGEDEADADDLAAGDEMPDGTTDEADERVDDEPPWRRGRAGTAIGRAVHAVLQTIDLATGDGATSLAAAQAAAEGVPDLATVIEQRVRSVLESPSVKAAVATGRYWREVFVAVPVGERVLEGFIDLLYEDADGELVVVDYKTDGVRNEADADEAVGRYRLQAAAYAARGVALAGATGVAVRVRVREPDEVVRARARRLGGRPPRGRVAVDVRLRRSAARPRRGPSCQTPRARGLRNRGTARFRRRAGSLPR